MSAHEEQILHASLDAFIGNDEACLVLCQERICCGQLSIRSVNGQVPSDSRAAQIVDDADQVYCIILLEGRVDCARLIDIVQKDSAERGKRASFDTLFANIF